MADSEDGARGGAKGACGLFPQLQGAGAELLLGVWGRSPQKLEYKCILCNGKTVFVNTKM